MKTPNQIQAEQARRAAEEVKRLAAFHHNIRFIAKTPEGKSFITWVLSLCHLYDDGYSTDPGYMAHISGMRSIGLRVIEVLGEADPTIYPRLLLEAQDGRPDRNSTGRNTTDRDTTDE